MVLVHSAKLTEKHLEDAKHIAFLLLSKLNNNLYYHGPKHTAECVGKILWHTLDHRRLD